MNMPSPPPIIFDSDQLSTRAAFAVVACHLGPFLMLCEVVRGYNIIVVAFATLGTLQRMNKYDLSCHNFFGLPSFILPFLSLELGFDSM